MNRFRKCSAIFISCLILASCNQTIEIPFPDELTEYSQPETHPLEFTDPQPLHWDTISHTELKPTVFPLDFRKMKGEPYDARGFKPLPAPAESAFEFASLPSKPFDLSRIPAHEIKMKWQPLASAFPSVKVKQAERVTAASIDLTVMQQLTGIPSAGPGYFLKDSSGFLWMGSTFGLYRYNGSHLETIIPAINVAGMNLDKQGRIWFINQLAVGESNIVMLDFENKKYGQMAIHRNFYYSSPMFRDTEGSLWIGSGQANLPPAIVKIDPKTMTYQLLDSTSGLKDQRYYQMVEDHEKNIWLCSDNGIDIIIAGRKRLVQAGKANGLSDDGITAITKDSQGRIWAAWPMGVDVIDLENKKVTHIQTSASPSRTFKLMFDKTGQLWQALVGGIVITNFKNNSFRTINEDDGLLPGVMINDIYNDDHGKLYLNAVLSNLSGLTYMIGQYGKTVYPFGNESISSTVEDIKENLWIGAISRLFVVDSARKTYWRINSSMGMANDSIESVIQQYGKIFLTTDGGYNIYDPAKKELRRFSRKEGLIPKAIYCVMPDNEGNQWISASMEGIFKYNPETKQTLNLTASGGLNGNMGLQTKMLKNGDIWSITDKTPGIINPVSNTIQTIKNIPELLPSSNKIIFVDSYERVWLAVNSQLINTVQLFMINSKNNTFTQFSTKNGLSSNRALSILEKEGKIIVGTQRMVNIITPPELSASGKWQINILKGSESLLKKENTFMSDGITKQGDYIWGDESIHMIYGIKADTGVSKCFVTGMDIMAKAINFKVKTDTGLQNNELKSLKWDSLSGPYAVPVNLRLPYNNNALQFHFTEMSSGRMDTTVYAFILEGIDTKWNTTADDHTQTYLNLSPRNYTFKVRSRSTSGRWSEADVMSFRILPPWYKTWWAYLIYAVVAVSLLRGYIVFRSRQLKKENKLLEEKVNHRTEELEKSHQNVEQLSEIGRKITSSLSVQNIIGTAYKNVNSLMDASVFGIGIYHAQTETIDFPATYENGEQLPLYSNSIHDKNRFGVICFSAGKEIIMSDLNEQYKDFIQHLPDPHAGEQSISLIYLPLTIKEKKLGVITVQSFKKNAYTDNHLNMLRNIANYTAIALENAESYSKLNQSLVNLKETQSQLIQSEKMASLGELTAGIAHEIQNPLNFVNNFSEVNSELIDEMNREIASGNLEEVKEIANDIKENEKKISFHGKRADAIVKGMLQHSRRNSGQKEPTDINALCDEYFRLSYHGLRAKDKSFNATMKTDFDDTIGKINLVPQDIGRVILNLINNAFYAVTEKKKNVSENYEPTVLISTKNKNDHIEIHVKDNGNGIPDEMINKIFQPFFTTKPTGQGTGLGLSLSYDIIKAHGGELKVETEEARPDDPVGRGQFTEFIILLPQ